MCVCVCEYSDRKRRVRNKEGGGKKMGSMMVVGMTKGGVRAEQRVWRKYKYKNKDDKK